MGIKQLNVTYFINDDRLIFRINTTDLCEYKFWLTRRLTHFILTTTGKFVEKEYKKNVPSVENVVSIFQQSENQGANFSTPFEPGVKYPIGADAILVMDAKCEIIKVDDLDIFSLDFFLPGGGSVNLKMPLPIIKNMILLLEEANMQAKWGNPISTFQ